ncbi:16651_t:CDS:2, partial [Acaulospora colombiana]
MWSERRVIDSKIDLSFMNSGAFSSSITKMVQFIEEIVKGDHILDAVRVDEQLCLSQVWLMATGDGGAYSYSLTVFSPSGKLVQIEHALARVSQGTTSLGIKGSYITYNSEVICGSIPPHLTLTSTASSYEWH